MKFKMLMKTLLSVAAATSFVSGSSGAEPGTWYVKAANFGKSGLDGRSEDTAWGTLQDAHDNASAGDTILVFPGDYDQGGMSSSAAGDTGANRLYVSRKLTFRSVVPKAAHIVGRHSESASGYGCGEGAVRCICVTVDGVGTVFEGFTVRDGATVCSKGADPLSTSLGSDKGGGGLYVLGSTTTEKAGKSADFRKVYLVDCVVSNCVSTWGGAMFGGTAIRCLLKDNAGSSFGEAACGSSLWNSVIACTRSYADRPTLGNYVIAVNCTVSGCEGYGADRSAFLYNCVFTGQEQSDEMQTRFSVNGGSDSVYDHCYGSADDAYPVISPATGDFRPRDGSPVVDGGVTAYLEDKILLPEGTLFTDYGGNELDLSSETCDAGAVQGAVAPGGGRFNFAGAVEVNGFSNIRASYSYAVDWPATAIIRPLTEKFFRMSLSGFTAGGSVFRYADENGLVQMLYPPFAGVSTAVTPVSYGYEFWCSPDADASVADGSEANPFRTLQAAMDALRADEFLNKCVMVRALPGEYAEGSAFAFSHTNRVVVPGNCAVFLKSVGGAAVTVIRGETDPDTENDAYYQGCGANSMRCVAFADNYGESCSRAIQGFTFADGRSDKVNYKTDLDSDRVGGVIVGGNIYVKKSCQVLDCVFTNCAAVRGGAAYNGLHSRCRYYDCHGYGGVFRYSYLSGCYVDPSCSVGDAPSDASPNAVLGTDTSTLFCTCPDVSYVSGMRYNTLFGDQDINSVSTDTHPLGGFYGSVFGNPAYISSEAWGYTIADALFVDAVGGDYRVAFLSPAVSGTKLPDAGTAEWGRYASNVWELASSDINGKALRITGGKIMSGCDHAPVPGIYVRAENGGLSLKGAVTGFTEMTDGLSVTVAAGNPGTRPCVGYLLNGATNLFGSAGAAAAVTPSAAGSDGGILLEALYSPNWYVNADAASGSDSNTGFSPDSPKFTLTAALANAIAGDTVHLAAGSYADGSAAPSGCIIPARALVPAGVTLEGAGAGETFIVGGHASVVDGNGYPRGDDAVRCVYLGRGATVRRCTLTGGATRSGWSDANAAKTDWHGAGACGEFPDDDVAVSETVVEDCIVSNCVAVCGGAGYGVTFLRSRLFECHATRGSAAEKCALAGTVADHMTSDGSSGLCLGPSYSVVNCTIGPDVKAVGGKDGASIIYIPGVIEKQYPVLNSVFFRYLPSSMSPMLENCVIVSGDVTGTDANFRKYTPEQIALDENTYTPDIASSPLVDRGLASDACGDFDAYGSQRVYNGVIDIGAVEADWRGVYAADISGRRAFSVTAASPAVAGTDDGVGVPEGSVLKAVWNSDGAVERSYAVTVRLAAASSATVKLNGEMLAECSGEGDHKLAFANALALNELEFSCTAGTLEILSASRDSGSVMFIR